MAESTATLIHDFEVDERLDKVLATAFPQYSRSALEKLIGNDKVQVNGKLKRTSYRLKEGDVIAVDISEFTREVPKIDLEVVFEDENVVVINKLSGVLTHAKGTLHNEATVATWLKMHVIRHSGLDPESSDEKILKQVQEDNSAFWESNRSGIVHRLDRGTSGLLICAKNEATQIHLQKQFEQRKVKKQYLAVISGTLDKSEGLIDVPIERNPKKPASFRPGNNGKSAQTHFAVRQSNEKYSLVELAPHTGRTHQLRVHMQFLGHPIVGDGLYSGEKAPRLMLHAASLELTLPSSERVIFTAPEPDEFKDYIDA